MLTMLVVDDEIYALKGITQGIEWDDLPISAILEAENVDQAKRTLQENRVDLIISDIDMPGANGLELLRYVREASPMTLVIFLTGHARFEYAQEAMHFGCFDYVLKPVDHDDLKEIVRRAVREIELRMERKDIEETIEEYRRQWNSQLPILVERFWQELLDGRRPGSADRLNRELAQYDIPLRAEDRVVPVLLSVEQWDVELDAKDESIMEYAVRKAAAEIILGEMPGAVLQTRGDLNLVLGYLPGADTAVDRQALKAQCRQYVKACNDYFHCRVSCYVGEPVAIGGLTDALDRLTGLERANVNQPQAVIDGSEHGETTAGGGGAALPSFTEWGILLDGGSAAELTEAIAHTMRRFQEETVSRETLEMFYFGFVHMLYQIAQRKGVPIHEAVSAQELSEGLAARTPPLMAAWATKAVAKLAEVCLDKQRESSAVIAKIQAYIQENLHQELNRDEIAHSVYRNPAYLSRLFRKETGLSLTDYIAQVKIERAKRLLADTNDKVSDIAEGLGYGHFSYFSKLFRKMTGATPQEYRKKHQNLP